MRLGERCLIADGAFAGSEITVFEHYAGDGDLIVGDRAFSNCKKLTSIELGDTEVIGNYAFRGCIALESVISKYQKKNRRAAVLFL